MQTLSGNVFETSTRVNLIFVLSGSNLYLIVQYDFCGTINKPQLCQTTTQKSKEEFYFFRFF